MKSNFQFFSKNETFIGPNVDSNCGETARKKVREVWVEGGANNCGDFT